MARSAARLLGTGVALFSLITLRKNEWAKARRTRRRPVFRMAIRMAGDGL